jgi:hypothetical protein
MDRAALVESNGCSGCPLICREYSCLSRAIISAMMGVLPHLPPSRQIQCSFKIEKRRLALPPLLHAFWLCYSLFFSEPHRLATESRRAFLR